MVAGDSGGKEVAFRSGVAGTVAERAGTAEPTLVAAKPTSAAAEKCFPSCHLHFRSTATDSARDESAEVYWRGAAPEFGARGFPFASFSVQSGRVSLTWALTSSSGELSVAGADGA